MLHTQLLPLLRGEKKRGCKRKHPLLISPSKEGENPTLILPLKRGGEIRYFQRKFLFTFLFCKGYSLFRFPPFQGGNTKGVWGAIYFKVPTEAVARTVSPPF